MWRKLYAKWLDLVEFYDGQRIVTILNILLLLYAACLLLSIPFLYNGWEKERLFYNEYVGRQFIYRGDTVMIIEFDQGKDRFVISKHGTLQHTQIFKLKEIK